MAKNNNTIPVVGKIYHMFDDGKITLSRHSLVKCIALIPFDEFQQHSMYPEWRNTISECDWLYSPDTDYIAVCKLLNDDGSDCEDANEFYYARTLDGGWFGFGTFLDDGRLDVDRTRWEMFKEDVYGGVFDYKEDALNLIAQLDKF